MSTVVAGLFIDSKQAGKAVSSLKDKGYTDSVSVLAKDDGGNVSTHQVKEDVSEGATVGAATGTAVGALTGLIAGAVTATIPGAVLLVAGPLAAMWGVTGAAVGALSGGIVGALVDAGFPDEKAKMFEEHVLRGEVLVAITGDDDKVDSMIQSLSDFGALEIVSVPQVA